jgi:hypothetical protein
LCLVGGLVLLASSAAQAGTLTAATWSSVIQGVPVVRTIGQLNATGTSTSTALNVSFTMPVLRPYLSPGIDPGNAFFVGATGSMVNIWQRISLGGMQALTASAGNATATQGVMGSVQVNFGKNVAKPAYTAMTLAGLFTVGLTPLNKTMVITATAHAPKQLTPTNGTQTLTMGNVVFAGSKWFKKIAGATLLMVPLSVGKDNYLPRTGSIYTKVIVTGHSAGSFYYTQMVNRQKCNAANCEFTDAFFVLTAVNYITVDFYAWTPGIAKFTGLTSAGNPIPNVTAPGSFNLTANGGGTVTLVSPSKITITGGLATRKTAAFTTLKLSFKGGDVVPEPGTLLLLGAGVAGLALIGSRKR